jgi:hypothetical protein
MKATYDATLCGMSRVRISTTVDSDLLARARASVPETNDAGLMDRALAELTKQVEQKREREVLARLPYDLDPELELPQAPLPDGLPYDGPVPHDVQQLADERRRQRQ